MAPVKYEEVYLNAYSGGGEAKAGLDTYFRFYNTRRPHQPLGNRTPGEVFNGDWWKKRGRRGRGGGFQTQSWRPTQEQRDPHLILPYRCPTDRVHLTLPLERICSFL